MAKGICPECQQLALIEPTGLPLGDTGSARWWRVASHPSKSERIGTIVVEQQCPGTGKLI